MHCRYASSVKGRMATELIVNIFVHLLRTLVFGLALLAVRCAIAQSADSVTHLQEVVIERQRIEALSVGHYALHVDSTLMKYMSMSTVADLLRRGGYGHIRAYGPSGLATPSFRGTGASHTAILWNGINLQSPLNGQSDLNLLPVFFVDDHHLQMGGSSSLNGSGAIGGTIHLNSKARFGAGWLGRVTLSAGSFENGFGGLGLAWSGKRFISSTRVFHVQGKNDFPFLNTNSNPAQSMRRAHSAVRQTGVLQENYWQVGRRVTTNFRLWYQDNDTELPNPSIVFRDSEANQRDTFTRTLAGIQFDEGALHLSFQSAHVFHRLNYADGAIALSSTSTFNSFINTVEGSYGAKRWELSAGINNIFEDGEAGEFNNNITRRNRTALYSAFKLNARDDLQGVLSFRSEMVNSTLLPFAPSFDLAWSTPSGLKISGTVSRNYRIPTMNDFYWREAGASGNPDLQAENSWSEEINVDVERRIGIGKLLLHWSAFSSQVDNWIIWKPVATGWSPENVKKVWSRGIESKVSPYWNIGKVRSSLDVLYSYTRSTNEEVYSPNDLATLQKQLVYTPMHEGSLTLRSAWNRNELQVNGCFTSKQFTDDDNTRYLTLKGYQTWNLWLTYDWRWSGASHALCQVEANNLFNTVYENRPGYPMPGRNFKASVTFYFRKPIKNEN